MPIAQRNYCARCWLTVSWNTPTAQYCTECLAEMATLGTPTHTPRPARMPSQGVPTVYVMGVPSMGLVKIGYTRDISRRLAQVRKGNAVPFDVRTTIGALNCIDVLAQHEAGEQVERALHSRLKPMRIAGEWFDFGTTQRAVDVVANEIRSMS